MVQSLIDQAIREAQAGRTLLADKLLRTWPERIAAARQGMCLPGDLSPEQLEEDGRRMLAAAEHWRIYQGSFLGSTARAI